MNVPHILFLLLVLALLFSFFVSKSFHLHPRHPPKKMKMKIIIKKKKISKKIINLKKNCQENNKLEQYCINIMTIQQKNIYVQQKTKKL